MAYAVNPNICQGCGVCAKTCPTGAIKVEDGKAIIDQTLCNQCGACVTVCPYGAIGADSAAFDLGQAGRLGRQMGRGAGRGRGMGMGRGKGRGGRGRW
ncbi:MAG TPA: 4Fe-4S binding protein [Thermosynergistes sp.]|nr:4Fe-4S binding protein [Thermosynergistes sp.]HXK89638.1 4Fe-4S binding protein [Thermosynergistes sp.]